MRTLVTLLLFPVFIIAQTATDSIALHLREIPRHNLSIDIGIAQPVGNYSNIARSGLSVGLSYDSYFNKNIGLTSAIRHTYNETAFVGSANQEPKNESITAITTGIVVSKTYDRFQIDAYARAGLSFINSNQGSYSSRNDEEIYNIGLTDGGNSFVAQAGLRFNYYFRRSVQIYFSPQFESTIEKPLTYTLVEPFSPPFFQGESKQLNISNLLFSVGVKFAIGRKYTSGELRDDSEPDN
jgi:hypothetical protein